MPHRVYLATFYPGVEGSTVALLRALARPDALVWLIRVRGRDVPRHQPAGEKVASQRVVAQGVFLSPHER